MQMRTFGRTGMQLSLLGFGCGAVGGFMVRGDPAEQERTVARALAAGVNYFDTAVQYGDGESENNLGRVLRNLKPAHAIVGTKVRLPSDTFGRIADTVATSLEGSLARLGRDHVDIFHLHNPVTVSGGGSALSVAQVLGDVVPAFEKLRQQGKICFLGMTAIGDTTALQQVIDSGAFDSAQIVYNMLNPSAAETLPANYPAQDYGRLFDHTQKAGVGVVGIRVLAGGALSGSTERHPIAGPAPEPIGSAMNYDADVDRARRLMPLVAEGFAASLTEAATRFSLTTRRWAPFWLVSRRRSNSTARWPRSKKARCPRQHSTVSPRCGRRLPANRADRSRKRVDGRSPGDRFHGIFEPNGTRSLLMYVDATLNDMLIRITQVLVITGGLYSIYLTGWIAERRGRSFRNWALLSAVLLGPLTIPLVYLFPNRRRNGNQV